jgi:hypothetical protein
LAQDSIEVKKQRQTLEAELQKAKRTPQENKLASDLLKILRRTEDAETSASKARELAQYLSNVSVLQFDQLGRILVRIEFDSLAYTNTILGEIRSLNGLVVAYGRTVPFITCRIAPRHLRVLSDLPEVRYVDWIWPSSTN